MWCETFFVVTVLFLLCVHFPQFKTVLCNNTSNHVHPKNSKFVYFFFKYNLESEPEHNMLVKFFRSMISCGSSNKCRQCRFADIELKSCYSLKKGGRMHFLWNCLKFLASGRTCVVFIFYVSEWVEWNGLVKEWIFKLGSIFLLLTVLFQN